VRGAAVRPLVLQMRPSYLRCKGKVRDRLSTQVFRWSGPVALRLLTDFSDEPVTYKKPNQTLYRPGVAQRIPVFPDYVTTAQHGGKVISLTHWPPLPPGNTPGIHFC